jgi:hypothetical protein
MRFDEILPEEAAAMLAVNFRPPTLATATLAGVLCLACAACSGSKEKAELYPADGKVLVDGKPAHRAIVWLHPVEPSEAPRPHGTVDRDGTFRLSTYNANDGAPAGSYRVTVFWHAPGKFGDEDGESLLPARYMNPATSGLPVLVISEGSNELPPLKLTK